jgi:hypothetical protein
MNGYDLRVSKEFQELHLSEGKLSIHVHDDVLMTISGPVKFDVPYGINSWKQGETKRITSKSSVALHQYHRLSKLASWGEYEKIERRIVVEMKKYKGQRLPGGRNEKDSVVIEKLYELLEEPSA